LKHASTSLVCTVFLVFFFVFICTWPALEIYKDLTNEKALIFKLKTFSINNVILERVTESVASTGAGHLAEKLN
jgi:hypothetical protein